METPELIDDYLATRRASLDACAALAPDDFCLQAEAFTSPPKWHLAHTSWFFETFILKLFAVDYHVFHPSFEILFNSYYNAVGEQFPRPKRGLLSRPTLPEIRDYRAHVDAAMLRLLENSSHPDTATIQSRCALGIQHEQQHQELFFTDIKYSLFQNPLYPSLVTEQSRPPVPRAVISAQKEWLACEGGQISLGRETDAPGFGFDNESPRHRVYLEPYEIGADLVSNADYLAFVEDGGYQRAELWLADAWATVQAETWTQPLYWILRDNEWWEYTLEGLRPLALEQPAMHLSAYEADAFANWSGCRLPTEAEWEHAFERHTERLENGFGECWQWTGSAYRPYPGFRAAPGAIGEYNGKFMSNQWVLRGSSCVTPEGHARVSYRNFFYPQDRWQFTGLRLARTP